MQLPLLLALVPAAAGPALPQDPAPADAARRAAADAALAAQELAAPGPRELPALDVERALAEAAGLHALGDGLVGVGPGFAATFDARGFRLRSTAWADRGLGLAFRLDGVARGGASLPLAAAPAFVRSGPRAVAAHGDALEERYEVRPEGVEQSFVLRALPAGAGDLVIRGRVETPLAAPDGVYDDGLALARDGDVRVRVGGVRAFDADGRAIDGRLRWSGDALELVVPAAFVDTARLPLLVDPLVTVEWDVWPGARELDVAYDAANDLYAVVWWIEAGFVQALRFDAAGNTVGGLIQVSDPGVAVGPATVANLNASDSFPVAYQVLEEGAAEIRVRSIDAASGAVSGFAKTALGHTGALLPQVGGDPIPPYDDALVLWSFAGNIYYHLAECAPGATPVMQGSQIPVPYVGPQPIANWRVTNSNGPVGTWLSTYDYPAEFGRNVHGLLINFAGSYCGTFGSVAGDPDADEHHAAPAGDGTNFAVVYQQDHLDLGKNIYAVCLTAIGPLGCDLAPNGLPVPLLDLAGVDAFLPDVEIVDGAYLAAWGRGDGKLESVRLSPTTCGRCGPNVIASDKGLVGPDPGSVRLASRFSSSFAPDDQALVAWEDDPVAHAALVEATQDGGVVDLGGGCDGGPDFSWLGDPNLGSDLDLVLDAVPEGAFSAGLMVAPSDQTFDLGGCDALLPSFTIPLAVDPPQLVLKVPLPCDGDFVGVTWRFQYVVVGVPGAPVTGIPGVTLSNAIELTFGG